MRLLAHLWTAHALVDKGRLRREPFAQLAEPNRATRRHGTRNSPSRAEPRNSRGNEGGLWFRYQWLPAYSTIAVTVLMVLLTAQVLAHGMTRPLREMTAAVARASADGQVVLEVRDEGPGIPVEDRARMFQRFTRGERAGDGGTGLGLAIAR
jgi:Histidine kinase-, DNA gyrase B-, and HSP90-like ATPase